MSIAQVIHVNEISYRRNVLKDLLGKPIIFCKFLIAALLLGFYASPATALVGGALAGEYDLTVGGPTVVSRGDSYYDPDDLSLFIIDTEIVSMNLTGSHQVLGAYSMCVSSDALSLGQISGQHDGTEDAQGNPNPEFPADSFFDVFFEIELQDFGLTIYNQDALHMATIIDGIPPYGNSYQYSGPGVLLYSSQVGPHAIGRRTGADHTPIPEPSTIVLFACGLAMVVADSA
jgi:hypothetical protein